MQLQSPFRLVACALGCLAIAGTSFGQKKEVLALQRDVVVFQENMRISDQKINERIAALEALLKQTLETTTKLTQQIAVIERSLNKQADAIEPPLNRTAAKVDALTNQYGALREAVEESNSMVARLQQEVADVKDHLTTLPPPSYGAPGGDEGGLGEEFLTAAIQDFQRGNYDFAEPQFRDFLNLSPNSPRAVDAQWYIAQIQYQKGDYEKAINEFDMVLENYPVGARAPQAQFKKGMALMQLGRNEDAASEFQGIVDNYPGDMIAENARDKLAQVRGSKPSPTRR